MEASIISHFCRHSTVRLAQYKLTESFTPGVLYVAKEISSLLSLLERGPSDHVTSLDFNYLIYQHVTLALNPPIIPTGDGRAQPVPIEDVHIILLRKQMYLYAAITSFEDAVNLFVCHFGLLSLCLCLSVSLVSLSLFRGKKFYNRKMKNIVGTFDIFSRIENQ